MVDIMNNNQAIPIILSFFTPTRERLRLKHIPIKLNMCLVCGIGLKLLNHVLVSCFVTQEVWYQAGFHGLIGNFDSYSMRLRFLFEVVDRKMWRKIALLLCSLWKNQNNVVWDN